MTSVSYKNITVATLALSLSACATIPGPEHIGQTINGTFNDTDPCANNARNTGVLVGALAGAVLGAKLGNKDKGAVLAGALIGSAAGGVIGADIDQRRCELAKVARQYNLKMSFAAVTSNGAVMTDADMQDGQDAKAIRKNAIGHVVSLQDDHGQGGHFESNSAVLTRQAEQYFSAIADIYKLNQLAQATDQQALRDDAGRKLLLVGHTDDTGSSVMNAELSERRARAVAEYLERRGIPRHQVFYQGAGEVYPTADNNTEPGRAQNRRVEIVELSDGENFNKYLAARRPNYQYYRAATDELVSRDKLAQAAPSLPSRPAARRKTSSPENQPPSRPVPAKAAKSSAKVAGGTPAQPSSTPYIGRSRPVSHSVVFKPAGKALDFGGSPLAEAKLAAASVGTLQARRPLFALISSAYANDLPVISECTQDRPRISGAVRALKDGATYKVAEHVPGLYGKTWTQRVNGHQVVINKVAVLANEASLAQTPELKIYSNYDPGSNRNPKPDVSLRPEVNTYLGEGGILYRMFTNGAAGMQCVDILYSRQGGASARDGNIVYARGNQLYVSSFKPVIAH